MNWRLGILLWGCVCSVVGAQPLVPVQPTPTRFTVAAVSEQSLHMGNTGAHNVELVCPRQGPTQTRPARPSPEPTEIPTDADVEQALMEARTHAQDPVRAQAPSPTSPGSAGWRNKSDRLRVAIWGDSHMAAAFFSDEMVRQMSGSTGAEPARVSSRFVHAGVGHGGVRALVRKTCLTGDWGREMAYAHTDAAATPGPGMTSLVAKRPGATLALDLRDAHGQARHTQLQLLHHGEGADQTLLAISVDGEAEKQLSLTPQTGPHALTLTTDAPLSTLQIRVLEGAFRFQGLKLAEPSTPAPLHLDLFAYPGATVAGWVRSDLGYLTSWFTDQAYDLALIAFGTNEGNDPRFSETAYRDTLNQALGNFRQVFPQTQCVLIGPGDRGVRVAKPRAAKGSKKQTIQKQARQNNKAVKSRPPTGKAQAQKKSKAPAANLLKYSRIHAQIGQIQAELAAQHGCLAWSMQEAMGGVGSAYPWARKKPALMAPDLIHFTPAGYRELANTFMADFGLTAP